MLAARHRLREPAQFAAVTRCRPSLRSSGRLLVVYLARTDPTGTRSPRVGFVVSKALGTAVVRNRTKRRLRAQTAPLLAGVPCGVDVVVRALPAAAGVPSAELREELTRSLRRCVDRLAAGESS